MSRTTRRPPPRASSRARASSSSASATPGFEIARRPRSRGRVEIFLVSPRPVQTAVLANASVRVRYFEPLEDAAWGGGTFALDAAVERIERTESGGYRLHATGTTRP